MGSSGRYLGSTNCADIMGCGFNSPLELYMECVGLAPDRKPTEAMSAGLYFEEGLRKMLSAKLEKPVLAQDTHWRHPEYDFIGGTDDGIIHDGTEETGAELKLVGPHVAREFGDDGDAIANKYLLQCQHNMITGRRKRFVIGAFFMAEMELRIYRVERDEELCEMLLAREIHFWREHVLKKVPPAENDASIVREYLSRRYPTHSADMLEANDELRKVGYRLAKVRHESKRIDAEKDELENMVRAVIGGDDGINFPDEGQITWRKAKDGSKTDWESAWTELVNSIKAHNLGDASFYHGIIKNHTKIVPGSRRLLVKGSMFENPV